MTFSFLVLHYRYSPKFTICWALDMAPTWAVPGLFMFIFLKKALMKTAVSFKILQFNWRNKQSNKNHLVLLVVHILKTTEPALKLQQQEGKPKLISSKTTQYLWQQLNCYEQKQSLSRGYNVLKRFLYPCANPAPNTQSRVLSSQH